MRVRARQVLGEPTLAIGGILLTIDEVEHDDTLGEPQRGLDGVGESLLRAGLDGEAVDDDLDVVLLLLLQLRRIGQRVDDPVDTHAGVALDGQLLEEVDELAFRVRTTGARTWKRAPASISSTWSTICCGVCREICSPQTGQCGVPARAYSRRR